MSATHDEMTIDLDSLSFQDLIDVQRATGTKVTRETLGDPGIDVVAALLWVTLRKEQPALTFEEFCRQGVGVELAGPKSSAGQAGPTPLPAKASKASRAS